MDDQEIREQVAEICNSDTLSEAFGRFYAARHKLRDWKFVFAARSGSVPGYAVNRDFARDAAVRSLFNSSHILVVDARTCDDMLGGRASYPMDFSISLDSQALSYLEPYLEGRASKIPSDFQEVFEFVARPDVNVDPIPYMQENLGNLSRKHGAERIKDKLKAYEVLRTIDVSILKSEGLIRSRLSDAELEQRAEEGVAMMRRWRGDQAARTELEHWHRCMYVLLLKMAQIQLRNPSAPLSRKLFEFLDFCDRELATIFTRESVLAVAYFERGQKLRFFDKIQKNKEDLLWLLQGMAWDLWHVRALEQALTRRPETKARYFFPALLTFDKRLIEVIDMYPLKACAYVEGTSHICPFFEGDLISILAGDHTSEDTLIERYFSKHKRRERQQRHSDAKMLLPLLVEKLEWEFVKLVGKPQSCPAPAPKSLSDSSMP